MSLENYRVYQKNKYIFAKGQYNFSTKINIITVISNIDPSLDMTSKFIVI